MVKPAKEFVSRVRRRPADCGMPGDGVSFQKNAGYEGDSSDPGRVEQKTPRSVSTAW